MRRMHTDEEIKALSLNVAAASIAALGISQTEDGLNVDGKLTADEIVENMAGYSFTRTDPETGLVINYAGVVKNGNKLTFALAGTITRNSGMGSNLGVGYFDIPEEVGSKLIPNSIGALDNKTLDMFDGTTSFKTMYSRLSKSSNTRVAVTFYSTFNLTTDVVYEYRYEVTFLLSENLAPQN